MKKFLSLLLVLCMVFSLFACAGSGGGGNGDGDRSGGSGKRPGSSKNLSGPEHLAVAETGAMQKLTGLATRAYGSLTGLTANADSSTGVDVDVKLSLGDELKGLLLQSIVGGPSDIDLEWLSEIMVELSSDCDGDLFQVDLGLGLNDANIATARVITDLSDISCWIGIPELSSEYIFADSEDLGLDMEAAAGAMSTLSAELLELGALLPEETELEELIDRYFTVILNNLSNVEKETMTVELEGLSQECTALTVTITEEDIYKVLIAVLEEAQDDAELKEIIENIGEYSNEMMEENAEQQGYEYEPVDVYEEFLYAVEDGLDELSLKLENCESAETLCIVDYVDDYDNIIGRTITAAGEEERIHYLRVTEGDEYVFEAELLNVLTVTGSGTLDGDKRSGEYLLTAEGVDALRLEIEDLDCSGLDEGYLSGTIRLIPEDGLLEEMASDAASALEGATVELVLDIGGKNTLVGLNIYRDDEIFLGVELSVKQTAAGSITKPDRTVDVDDEEGLANWILDLDFDELIRNLKNAGIPSDYTDILEELVDELEDSYSSGR